MMTLTALSSRGASLSLNKSLELHHSPTQPPHLLIQGGGEIVHVASWEGAERRGLRASRKGMMGEHSGQALGLQLPQPTIFVYFGPTHWLLGVPSTPAQS